MAVKEDGSKWACQPCLKGHRARGCIHTDRELTPVPKKGRPITQCPHCRLERKKRSAHVRCDCGETEKPQHLKEKCIHLQEAEERARAGYHDEQQAENDPVHLATIAEEQGCCCHHGGKCSCALLKKKTGDVTPHGPAVKPRLEQRSSEGAITVFSNGHHKSVHRKNHAAHECGMPYKMPMPRSFTDASVSRAARGFVESLALDGNMPFQPSAFTAQTCAPFNPENRKSKSEQHSPRIPGVGVVCWGLGDAEPASIEYGNLTATQTNQSLQSTTGDTFSFPLLDPISGVTESSFDPCPALPSADSTSMPNNNPFGAWPTSIDTTNMVQPALTAASSGMQSEFDEMPEMDDAYGLTMPTILEDTGNYNLNSMPPGNSPQCNRRSLPPGFVDNTDIGTGVMGSNEWQAPGNFNGFGPHCTPGGLPNSLGPQSRSLEPGSGPNDAIIKQLFPDIEISGSMFSATDGPQAMSKSMGVLPSSTVTSAPIDFGPIENNVGFTFQPWSDGSMSMPDETFTRSFDVDQDFSNPDFSANWVLYLRRPIFRQRQKKHLTIRPTYRSNAGNGPIDSI